MKIISSKSIFASLILIIILIFIANGILNKNEKLKSVYSNKIPKDNIEKILGVKIHQQNKNGDKFFIVAESLIESDSINKKVLLENSITTIDQNGVITVISAGHAIISNDYENFDFSDKIIISKKTRKFVLKTDSLAGSFEEGDYYTNDEVDIVSGNTKIKGKGLDVKKNGQYVKVKGKVVLNMLLSNKK